MISLEDFEGLSGYRWGALVRAEGPVAFSSEAPPGADSIASLVARVLEKAGLDFPIGDFHFQNGKVLLRRGSFGLLMLFCDERTNSSMVNVILQERPAEAALKKSVGRSTDSHLSGISSFSFDSRAVPDAVVEELLNMFTQVLGPLARVLAKKAAVKAGLELDALAAKDFHKLLNALAERISDEVKRENFVDRAIMLKTKL